MTAPESERVLMYMTLHLARTWSSPSAEVLKLLRRPSLLKCMPKGMFQQWILFSQVLTSLKIQVFASLKIQALTSLYKCLHLWCLFVLVNFSTVCFCYYPPRPQFSSVTLVRVICCWDIDEYIIPVSYISFSFQLFIYIFFFLSLFSHMLQDCFPERMLPWYLLACVCFYSLWIMLYILFSPNCWSFRRMTQWNW